MKYSDIPFEIINCKNCDMEIPDYQGDLCLSCYIDYTKEIDYKQRMATNLLIRQKALWKRDIFNKGLSTLSLPKDQTKGIIN